MDEALNTLLVVKLEVQQWNVILAGLGELPLKFSLPVHAAVLEQLQGRKIQANGLDHLHPMTHGLAEHEP